MPQKIQHPELLLEALSSFRLKCCLFTLPSGGSASQGRGGLTINHEREEPSPAATASDPPKGRVMLTGRNLRFLAQHLQRSLTKSRWSQWASQACLVLFVTFGATSGLVTAQDALNIPAGGTYVGDMIETYDGFTQPRHEIMLAADEMGRLETVNVIVGQRIEAGHLVAGLEDALQVASLKTAVIQADMVGELDAAKVERELNEIRTKKLRTLAANGMARPDELRRAEADWKIAKARVASIEEQGELRAAERERAEVQLQRRKVFSPAAGVISEVFLSPGEFISPSAPAIAELLVIDELIAVFDVPIQDMAGVEVGRNVQVRLRSDRSSIEAAITSITPKIDGESGTVQVRVMLDNADRKWLSGDRCTLQIHSPDFQPKKAPAAPTNLSSTHREWEVETEKMQQANLVSRRR